MNNIFSFRAFFNYLKKNKVYTLINVFGLAVSLTFAILIAVYVNRERSVDRFHQNGDRIYLLGNEKNLDCAYRLAYSLQERYAEIEKVCPLIPRNRITGYIGENKFRIDMLFTDPTFFDFFDFKLHGDRTQTLVVPNSAVVSRSFARKAFGNDDPVGQTIRFNINEGLTVTVVGVMDDIANSTVPYSDILVQSSNIRYFNETMDSKTFDNAAGAYICIMEKDNADLKAKTDDMTAFFKEIFWTYIYGMSKTVTLTPLKDVYFSEIRGNGLQHGDSRFVSVLLAVGLAILVFALINYINLTVAQAGFRAKEMAMRRLLGASRSELFARLIIESTMLCFLVFILAVWFAHILTPYAGALLDIKGIRTLTMDELWTPAGICVSIATILFLGIVSGWLPAMIISRVKPIDITKGSMKRKNKMVFSRYFITFQHAITVLLLVSTITVVSQTQHLVDAPLGYNTKNIIYIPNPYHTKLLEAVADETRKLASVKRVAFASGTPFEKGGNYWSMPFGDKMISVQILVGDSAYVDMLGIKILRDNHQDGAYYFSQTAMKEFGLDDDALMAESQYTKARVGGIIQDVRIGNILDDVRPIWFKLGRNEYIWSILVEVQGDPKAAFQQVAQTYERIVGLTFEGQFIDDQIADSFAQQRQISTIILVFTGIAILISVLGLLAMSMYFIRQRTKEIAVRKVYGASFGEVLTQLLRTFLTYVVLAFFIALPFSWYIMRWWLDGYSYRIELSPWIFVAAGVFCFAVSLATVFWQSRIAANTNPINSLKEM